MSLGDSSGARESQRTLRHCPAADTQLEAIYVTRAANAGGGFRAVADSVGGVGGGGGGGFHAVVDGVSGGGGGAVSVVNQGAELVHSRELSLWVLKLNGSAILATPSASEAAPLGEQPWERLCEPTIGAPSSDTRHVRVERLACPPAPQLFIKQLGCTWVEVGWQPTARARPWQQQYHQARGQPPEPISYRVDAHSVSMAEGADVSIRPSPMPVLTEDEMARVNGLEPGWSYNVSVYPRRSWGAWGKRLGSPLQLTTPLCEPTPVTLAAAGAEGRLSPPSAAETAWGCAALLLLVYACAAWLSCWWTFLGQWIPHAHLLVSLARACLRTLRYR